MMWWDHGAWGVGDWVAMSLMMLVFWGLIVGGIVWLVRSMGDKPAATDQRPHSNPDQVLADRFARGEMSEEEFTRRRALLHGTTSASRGMGSE